MKTKFFTLFVALVCATSAFAHDLVHNGIYYTILSDSTVMVVKGYYSGKYEEYKGYVNIPAWLYYGARSYKVIFISGGAFSNCPNLTGVSIPNTVIEIGNKAFSGCSSLTEVTIPNSVTTIGEDAFRGCSSLTEVTIPNSVTSIENNVFNGCSSLTEVTIPNSVTYIGSSAFSDCSSLTSITIPNSVTSIGEDAFYGCSSLQYSTYGNINYLGNLENPYYALISPTNISITSCTIHKDTKIMAYSALKGCSSLTKVTIDNGVTSIGSSAFSDCSSLTEVTIPNSVTSIGSSAFSDCSSLTGVSIPNTVIEIGNKAFSGCSSLTEVTIPNSVTAIGYDAFYGCSSLTEVTIGESVTTIGDYAFKGCSSLPEIIIPNSVTSIDSETFSGCSSLTEVTIGESVTTIGEYAFKGCSSLTSVIWNAKNAEDFSSFHSAPFYDLRSQITSFTFGNKVKHIPAHLCEELNVSTVIIPNSVTTIGAEAFYDCSSLTEVTIGESVTSIGFRAFNGCSSLTEVTIPNSVTAIGYDAFYGCSSLTEVTIGESVTAIGGDAFSGCSSLTSITIPNSVTTIGGYAFCGCSSLTEVTIGESVTSIGSSAFYYCSSLTEVTIGESVTAIGGDAFRGCSSLQSVKIEAINPPTGNGSLSRGCKISVPCSALETYQQHSDWKKYVLQGYLAVEYTISVNSENTIQGTAVVTQEPSCDSDIAIIQATPKVGYHFVAWNDGNTDNPRSITVTQDTTFTATFAVVNVSAITLSKTTLQLPIGDTHQLVATVVPDNALNKNVTWSSSNAEVVSVVDGLVTAVSNGTATITATTEDGGFTATCEVTVTTPVSSISLDKTSLELIVGETEQLTATIEPAMASNQNIIWSSSNNNVATVANGLVTAVGNGTATITATTEDSGFTATCEVTVTTPVSSISLDKTSLELIVDETEQLTATIEPATASNQNITWSSSNNNVATVANGLVTAVSNGTATITATTEDGGYTATCEVIVVGDSNPNSEGITVRFKKPDDWSGVYLYAWNWNEEHTVVTEYLGSWPGTQLTEPDAQGWYSYTFDKTLTSVNFIFNNGGNGVQTADLFTTQSVCYEWDGTAAVLVDCPEGTAVENVPADGVSSVRKVLENGTIYIIRNGEKYTIDGRKVN